MYVHACLTIYSLYRMLVKYHPDFGGHEAMVNLNIPSEYSDEMSKKSVVVVFFNFFNVYLLTL